MKILRSHHGFTTNSSSASEWIRTGGPETKHLGEKFDAQGNLVTNYVSGSGSIHTTVVQTAKAPASTTAPASSNANNNLVMIGGLVGAVLGVFAIERIVRKALKKPAAPEDH